MSGQGVEREERCPWHHFQGDLFCYTQEGALPLLFSLHFLQGYTEICGETHGPLKDEGGSRGAGDKNILFGSSLHFHSVYFPLLNAQSQCHVCFTSLQQAWDYRWYEERADPRKNCWFPSHSQRHLCPHGARADKSFLPVSFFLSLYE